ncbi:MAG: NAD(P)/FAD-dependent oxidoreductase [Myxococcota bacterium]|nr:NAD(P)/FAD-dependent oxidoreductase [Myxococcota bacterium]
MSKTLSPKENGAPPSDRDVIIVGAGPAGLTAALLLAEKGWHPIVLEADPRYVGGISRTVEHEGYHFDIGGHRFFSKAREVEEFWSRVLPDDMLTRPRKSRIFYGGGFFSYPLKPVEALLRLGPVESARCMLSFAHARVRPIPDPKNFEDWVRNQFGRRLYEIFFKHYTEKVWGMSCRELSADWAAQRIKSLSLGAAVVEAIKSSIPGFVSKGGGDRAQVHTTLIDEFRYPRKGPGQLWEECARKVKALGGEVRMGARVVAMSRAAGSASGEGAWTVRYEQGGKTEELSARQVISSAAIRDVVASLEPAPAPELQHAAKSLRYRDFLTVALMVRDRDAFDDNWIYIQEPHVKVGRIQNFKAWSPEMVPAGDTACYGLEYFCFEGDGLWASTDEALIELATSEIETLGLTKREDVRGGCVVRQPKAYPVYDDAYARHVDTVRDVVARDHEGLFLVGRNGMHRYNNQDHSMMTAMLTVENIVSGTQKFDPWRVNQDAEYIEAGTSGEEQLIEAGGRSIPRAVAR